MAGCDDTRQLTEAQRAAAFQQQQRAGVMQAVRPFTGSPSPSNLIDYLNREVYPALRATRQKINDVYRQVTDNAPSGNPLSYYFSTETANADPTVGRLRFNSATQDTSTILRVSQTNARLKDVAVWLDLMNGSATSPLGALTLTDAADPGRFIRFDLATMTDAGAYWNLGVTPIESSHDSPFVDAEPIAISFIPGVAGSGAVLRYFPGAPIYDVMAPPFNAVGTLAGDDTAAINAAIAAANAIPGTIYLGQAHRITGALNPITNNNIRIVGRGEFNGGTILQVDSAAAVDAITISGCQYCSVERVWIVGTKVFTSGYGIRFVGTYRCFTDHVVITNMCFGVEHVNATLSHVYHTHLSDLYGTYGFLARGTGGNFNHAVTYEGCVCGTDYPGSIVGKGTVWATSTAYVVGNIVFANNNIYQCVQNGTSSGAGSGPSGSGTTAPNAHTTQITDGGAKWVFAMPLNIWFCQESGSQTFEVIDCGTLQGGYGLMVNDATSSVPLFTRVQNFQSDHPFSAGVQLNAGGAIRMNQILVTSVLEGSGIVITSAVSGNWEFIGGEVFGCNKAGVTIAKGDGLLEGLQIGGCGGISSNTRDCIEVTNSASRFRVVGCSGGAMFGATSPATRYGISIAAGSDNYVVVGNVFSGNVTAGILNTPGVALTRIVRSNVPDSTSSVPDGDYGDVTVSSSGAVWTVDNDVVTFAKMQNIGYGVIGNPTFATTTDPSLITPPGSFTVLQDDGTGVLAFHSLASTSIVHGALGVYQRAALTGDVTATQNSNATTIANNAVTTVKILNANVTDAKLQDRQPLSLFGRSTNTTGQGADIDAISGSGSVMRESGGTINWGTVAAAGLASDSVTTVKILDANVTLAKQANLAQSTIVGRAEGAGTGVPQALTPTQVTAIIDAETLFWTGAHRFGSDLIASGAFMFATVATAAVAAQVDNFNPGQATQCRFTLTGNQNLSGIVPPTVSEECLMLVENADDTDNLTLLHNNTGSSGANRFFLPGNTDRTLIARASALLHYDVTDGRWHMVYGV